MKCTNDRQPPWTLFIVKRLDGRGWECTPQLVCCPPGVTDDSPLSQPSGWTPEVSARGRWVPEKDPGAPGWAWNIGGGGQKWPSATGPQGRSTPVRAGFFMLPSGAMRMWSGVGKGERRFSPGRVDADPLFNSAEGEEGGVMKHATRAHTGGHSWLRGRSMMAAHGPWKLSGCWCVWEEAHQGRTACGEEVKEN
jgi:hypothetical protein